MTKVEVDIPQAHKPYYEHAPNKPIDLYEGKVTFSFKGQQWSGQAKIYHTFFPSQRTKIDFFIPDLSFFAFALSSQIITVDIESLKTSIFVRVTGVNSSTNNNNPNLSGILLPNKSNSGQALKSLQFHLANIPQLIGGEFVNVGDRSLKARVNFSIGEWRLVLDPVKSIDSAIKSFKNDSGFALTYCGQIFKIDGSEFRSDDVGAFLSDLGYMFTFALGHWTNPILYVGHSSAGEKCWFDWTPGRVGKWSSAPTWFDDTEIVHCNQLLNGIVKRRLDPIWQKELPKFLHWYIESQNNISLDSAIILIQAALELFSWILLVEEQKKYDPEKFDKKSAATKIRLLLENLGVSLSIPSQFVNLIELSDGIDGKDGPGVFTKVRNTTVHPRDRKLTEEKSVNALYECRQLGLWYFELALLKLFEFEGNYFPRYLGIKYSGLVKPLPWNS